MAAGSPSCRYVGDFLCFDRNDLTLEPMLAESWSPNKDGTVWTFKLRQGVKFHNGKPMTADDVVASIDRLADPANGSNALSVFTGYLSKGGTRKVDDHTVEFHLDAANGNFPYLVSTDNYNAIILPADYAGDFEQSMIGTGPVQAREIYPASRRVLRAQHGILGRPGGAGSRRGRRSMPIIQPQILALQGGQIDIIQQVAGAAGRRRCSTIRISTSSALPSTAHQQVHMRNDMEPFKDKRVRRAVALMPRSAKAGAGPDEGPGQDRQRQPVRRRLSDRPTRACRNANGHRRGQGS